MIASIWGLAALGRTDPEGMPGLLDRALLGEAFGEEIVFERPPAAVQRAFARALAPLGRAGGRSVTSEAVIAAACTDPRNWAELSRTGSAILPGEGK
jgi:hypothetical protein